MLLQEEVLAPGAAGWSKVRPSKQLCVWDQLDELVLLLDSACVCAAPMPQLSVSCPGARGGAGQAERRGWCCACKWMEDAKEDGEGGPAERSRDPQCANQTPADVPFWPQLLWTLRRWRGWHSFAPAAALWSVCHVEALLHPSLFAVDVCGRLLLVCLLWVAAGGCVLTLKCCLWPGRNQAEPPQRIQQEVVPANRIDLYSWRSQSQGAGLLVPLALALADGLLLCVLQELLPDPSVPHIHSLLSRLESVSQTLEKADGGSEMTLTGMEQHSILTNKVKLIHTYLQQRIRSLRALVQVQSGFEAGVKDMLKGLDGLWAQLEELHTGVTLTKEGSRGHRDLALVLAEAESLVTVLGHYRSMLQSCQANLKDSMQLLQDLTWSHTHLSNSVRCGGESVWPELLLQSNIEQFDKLQERFLSLDQQTCTFQAHLEGLGSQERHAGPPARTNEAQSCSASTSPSTRASSADPHTDTEAEAPMSLCERSALQFSSTVGRLRLSGRKK